MRKIYQTAPDVPQGIANRAIEIIERHLTSTGARRAEDLPEENKIHLMRELQKFFQTELPPLVQSKEGKEVYARGSKHGFFGQVIRWMGRLLGSRASR